jgi:dihydroneopterin aldolase/2-amino-4-hydroxy-6-hydroxymethyldihydropteridine diphosphokinase
LDAISLRGIKGRGFHGLLPAEERDGQTFSADVTLYLDLRDAARDDSLDRTQDYSVVARKVKDILEGERCALLETLAERIAQAALDHGAVQAVDVIVHKPEAPLEVPFDDVSVAIRRDRVGPGATFVAPDSAILEQVRQSERLVGLATPLPPGELIEFSGAGDGLESLIDFARRARAAADHPDQDADNDAAEDSEEASDEAVRGSAQVDIKDLAEVSGKEDRPFAAISRPKKKAAKPRGGHQDEAEGPESKAEPAPKSRRAGADETAAPVDQIPDAPVDAIVALGANLGDALATLRAALEDLRAEPGIEVAAVSPMARTAPVGRTDQPDFFNAVVHLRTTLSPRTLLHTLQGIEEKHGRRRTGGRWAPRTLDLDLIAYETLLADEDDLILPHPLAHERSFVLVPWSMMTPGAFLPGLGGGPVAELAERAPDRGCIRWLAPDWHNPPPRRRAPVPGQAGSSGAAPASGSGAIASRLPSGRLPIVDGVGVRSGALPVASAGSGGLPLIRDVSLAAAAPDVPVPLPPVSELPVFQPGVTLAGALEPVAIDAVGGLDVIPPLLGGEAGGLDQTNLGMAEEADAALPPPLPAPLPVPARGARGATGGAAAASADIPVAAGTAPPAAALDQTPDQVLVGVEGAGQAPEAQLPAEVPAGVEPAEVPATSSGLRQPGVPDFFAQARKANRARKMVVVESGSFAGQAPEGDFDFGVAEPVFEPNLQPPQPAQAMPIREPFQSLPQGFPMNPFGDPVLGDLDMAGQGAATEMVTAVGAVEPADPLQGEPSQGGLVAGNPSLA